jgi:hypothetical protein
LCPGMTRATVVGSCYRVWIMPRMARRMPNLPTGNDVAHSPALRQRVARQMRRARCRTLASRTSTPSVECEPEGIGVRTAAAAPRDLTVRGERSRRAVACSCTFHTPCRHFAHAAQRRGSSLRSRRAAACLHLVLAAQLRVSSLLTRRAVTGRVHAATRRVSLHAAARRVFALLTRRCAARFSWGSPLFNLVFNQLFVMLSWVAPE